MDRPAVAVLFGGRSSEHSISCATAGGVLRAIDRDRYEVIPVGITRDGAFVLEDDDPEQVRARRRAAARGRRQRHARALARGRRRPRRCACGAPTARSTSSATSTSCFPILHGLFGEDGTVQGLSTRSACRTSAAACSTRRSCMDKHFTKIVLAGAPACRSRRGSRSRAPRWARDPELWDARMPRPSACRCS